MRAGCAESQTQDLQPCTWSLPNLLPIDQARAPSLVAVTLTTVRPMGSPLQLYTSATMPAPAAAGKAAGVAAPAGTHVPLGAATATSGAATPGGTHTSSRADAVPLRAVTSSAGARAAACRKRGLTVTAALACALRPAGAWSGKGRARVCPWWYGGRAAREHARRSRCAAGGCAGKKPHAAAHNTCSCGRADGSISQCQGESTRLPPCSKRAMRAHADACAQPRARNRVSTHRPWRL